jgi:phosphatidylserine decarboxylase
MAREGWIFLGPALAVIALGAVLTRFGHPIFGWILLIVGALATLAFAYFFRDPERQAPEDADAVIATSDGKIIIVAPRATGGTQIDTFLSVFDVHVNRAPVSGVVKESQHRPGRFLVAYEKEAGLRNERHDLVIDSPLGTIRSAQIAGILARRIICRPKAGDTVSKGERIGMIRFGSRAEVIVPDGFAPAVKLGDRVRAGETILARRTRA